MIKEYIQKLFLNMAILNSKKSTYKLFKFINKIFGERNPGNIDFNFSSQPSRIEIVKFLLKYKVYNSYLEIGTFNDELFSKIDCKIKIGVDPYSGGNVRLTSDEFFKKNNQKFDLIFIDGLHHYDQVIKDISNSLKYLNSNGIILIHDCLPSTIESQLVPRISRNWNGDVWKAFLKQRKDTDLDCYTILADEGIGVIFKRKNSNILKFNINNFKRLKYKFFYDNYKSAMNVITFEKFKDLF